MSKFLSKFRLASGEAKKNMSRTRSLHAGPESLEHDFLRGKHESDGLARRLYFVNIGFVGVGGVAAAGERLNVSQRFQPAGRFSLANSP